MAEVEVHNRVLTILRGQLESRSAKPRSAETSSKARSLSPLIGTIVALPHDDAPTQTSHRDSYTLACKSLFPMTSETRH